jgi:hypothetical protein
MSASTKNLLRWGRRQVLDRYILGERAVFLYEVPYDGVPNATAIVRGLRKSAPPEYFGQVYEPTVIGFDATRRTVRVQIVSSLLKEVVR